MALNAATFKTRTLTAVIFVIVMLGGMLWNEWSFLVLMLIIHTGAWTEFQKLLGQIDPRYAGITVFHRYAVIIAGCCLILLCAGDDLQLGELHLHALGWWLGLIVLFALPILELLFNPDIHPSNLLISVLGLLYLSLPLALMVDLRSTDQVWMTGKDTMMDMGMIFPLSIVFSIWINDTMAYIVGSLIGKTPLSPISPKKTWEGTIGGIVLGVLVLAGLAWLTGFSVADAAIIAALAAVAGTLGDLLESWIKRKAGVKDSGTLMPGHGGFLDRFDSMLLAIPAVWVYVTLVLL